MKEIKVVHWCDYPECSEAAKEFPMGQVTRDIEFWVYTPGKGRKPNPIRVEVCESHEAELKNLYYAMQKADQKRAE
jgi:hypothetical protein